MSSSTKAKRLTSLASILVALMVACFASVSVMAQATTGTLRGTVTDAQGGVIAGANVTVKNEATGASATFTTNSEGTFDAPALLPGGCATAMRAVPVAASTSNSMRLQACGSK